MSFQNHLDFRDSATWQADSSGGPDTALNTSVGARPNCCALQRYSCGRGQLQAIQSLCTMSQISVQILGKNQPQHWCGEGLESVQLSDIMVAPVFADDVVPLASLDCGV